MKRFLLGLFIAVFFMPIGNLLGQDSGAGDEQTSFLNAFIECQEPRFSEVLGAISVPIDSQRCGGVGEGTCRGQRMRAWNEFRNCVVEEQRILMEELKMERDRALADAAAARQELDVVIPTTDTDTAIETDTAIDTYMAYSEGAGDCSTEEWISTMFGDGVHLSSQGGSRDTAGEDINKALKMVSVIAGGDVNLPGTRREARRAFAEACGRLVGDGSAYSTFHRNPVSAEMYGVNRPGGAIHGESAGAWWKPFGPQVGTHPDAPDQVYSIAVCGQNSFQDGEQVGFFDEGWLVEDDFRPLNAD